MSYLRHTVACADCSDLCLALVSRVAQTASSLSECHHRTHRGLAPYRNVAAASHETSLTRHCQTPQSPPCQSSDRGLAIVPNPHHSPPRVGGRFSCGRDYLKAILTLRRKDVLDIASSEGRRRIPRRCP